VRGNKRGRKREGGGCKVRNRDETKERARVRVSGRMKERGCHSDERLQAVPASDAFLVHTV